MLTYASITHPGSRKINEDSLGMSTGANGALFVLCDGLGGHGQGEVASELAVRAALLAFEAHNGTADELLPLCIIEAQNALIDEQTRQNRREDIKTTITLLHLYGDFARWAHVGDSRVYAFAGGKVAARTLDHSVPQMLVSQGEIREKDIRGHEDRNRLLRVLGMEWDAPKYTIVDPLKVDPPMNFLLCSDGFWELIEERGMEKALAAANTPEAWLAAMEKTVVVAGKGRNMDNYSAIAVFAR